MADSGDDPVQQPAATEEGRRIEAFALLMLRQVIKRSVQGDPDGKPLEWGGMIYVANAPAGSSKKGALGATRHKGFATLRVDVHDKDPNCGCPANTTPVAWYHTHPVDSFEDASGTRFTALSRQFIDGDRDVSDRLLLPGYVATRDYRFWRYDPPPQSVVDGKPVFNNGLPASDVGKEGHYGVLKPRVVPL
jgi:hypothetical protein